MNQNEINQNEWNNEANWVGPNWFKLYYASPVDTRVWVPKRIPWLGWTVNCGHQKHGKLILALYKFSVILAIVGLIAAISIPFLINTR